MENLKVRKAENCNQIIARLIDAGHISQYDSIEEFDKLIQTISELNPQYLYGFDLLAYHNSWVENFYLLKENDFITPTYEGI